MRSRLPYAVAFSTVLLVVVALSWPMPLYINDWHMITMFGDNHAWAFDRVARALAVGDLPTQTAEAGYPQVRLFRVVGWGPLLLSLPFRIFLSPIGAANLAQLLALPLSAVAATALVRRWTDAGPWVAAAMGVVYALCPTLLATYGMGEISTTAAWILPGVLLLLDLALERPALLPILGLFGLLSAFTSPFYALAMPLLALGWAGASGYAAVRREGGLNERSGEALRPTLRVLLVLAASMAPAALYFAPHLHDTQETLSVFKPAERSPDDARLPSPSPVARPHALLWESGAGPNRRQESQHSVYLGLALLGAAVGLSAHRLSRGGRGGRAGLALAVGGAVLAMGPKLGWGDGYVKVGGWALSLPVALLEALGYPTADSGMYFRFVVLTQLGLVLLVAAGLSRLPRAALLAGGLAVLQVGDSVRATGALWPRPGEVIPGLSQLREMRGDEDDGAVLDLPLQGPGALRLGAEALLRASVHGRPTTALPRDVSAGESLAESILEEASTYTFPRGTLRDAGFRYVVLPMSRVRDLSAAEQAFVAKLGTPSSTGELKVWDLGPATERVVGLQQWASQTRASGGNRTPSQAPPQAAPPSAPKTAPSQRASPPALNTAPPSFSDTPAAQRGAQPTKGSTPPPRGAPPPSAGP